MPRCLATLSTNFRRFAGLLQYPRGFRTADSKNTFKINALFCAKVPFKPWASCRVAYPPVLRHWVMVGLRKAQHPEPLPFISSSSKSQEQAMKGLGRRVQTTFASHEGLRCTHAQSCSFLGQVRPAFMLGRKKISILIPMILQRYSGLLSQASQTINPSEPFVLRKNPPAKIIARNAANKKLAQGLLNSIEQKLGIQEVLSFNHFC